MKKLIKRIVLMVLLIVLVFIGYVVYYNMTKVKQDTIFKETIQKELKEAGKLQVLEGNMQYRAARVQEKNIPGTGIEIGNRTVNLNLQFNYGYAVELENISVAVSGDITIEVEESAIVLDYVYLDLGNSTIESKASLLVKNYTPQEINDIQNSCIQEVREKLENRRENRQKAKDGFEKQLSGIIKKVTGKRVLYRYK